VEKSIGKDVRTLFKLGRSLVMTIPEAYVKAHNLKPGDKVEVFYDDALHVEKINPKEILKKTER